MAFKTVEVITKKTVSVCDFDCNEQAVGKCAFCDKDVCNTHGVCASRFGEDFSDDINGVLCPSCRKKGEPHIKRIEMAQAAYNRIFEKEMKAWREKAYD